MSGTLIVVSRRCDAFTVAVIRLTYSVIQVRSSKVEGHSAVKRFSAFSVPLRPTVIELVNDRMWTLFGETCIKSTSLLPVYMRSIY
jgi:hypothetical protein